MALTWISARAATSAEARQLGLAPKSAALVEKRIISDQEGRPLGFTTTVYHPERYVIDAVLTLAQAPES